MCIFNRKYKKKLTFVQTKKQILCADNILALLHILADFHQTLLLCIFSNPKSLFIGLRKSLPSEIGVYVLKLARARIKAKAYSLMNNKLYFEIVINKCVNLLQRTLLIYIKYKRNRLK